MASIDFSGPTAPRPDRLGISLFVFHLGIGTFVLGGWVLPFGEALGFYLILLPAMAGQWLINRGSCILNNVETWLRRGRWRDPSNPEEGRFLHMLYYRLFRVAPSTERIDTLCYGIVLVLWLLGLGHLTLLEQPQLLAGFG